jgi:hypothetical protein
VERVSDQLTELSRRAKGVEDSAGTARAQSREKLTALVNQARDQAERGADRLRSAGERMMKNADDQRNSIHAHWTNLVRTARTDMRDAKADHDVARAQDRADQAEESAEWAVGIALAAVEEAEYAVLDAALARAEADDAVTGVR